MRKMIRFSSDGDWNRTHKFLRKVKGISLEDLLIDYAQKGCRALGAATPKDTTETAVSWGYEIVPEDGKVTIYWTNTHQHDGCSIALILEYGHGTKNGAWIEGRNYINPAIQLVMDLIAEELWRKVRS